MKEIRFDRDAGIKTANDFKKFILDSLNGNDDVVLTLSNQRRLDLSSLQIVCAARLEAKSLGKSFRITGVNPEIMKQFEICGYGKNGGGNEKNIRC